MPVARPEMATLVAPELPGEFTGAICQGSAYPPMTWDYEVVGESPADREDRYALAASICRECPVRALCAHVGESDELAHGVWGGRLFSPGRCFTGHVERSLQAPFSVVRQLRG